MTFKAGCSHLYNSQIKDGTATRRTSTPTIAPTGEPKQKDIL